MDPKKSMLLAYRLAKANTPQELDSNGAWAAASPRAQGPVADPTINLWNTPATKSWITPISENISMTDDDSKLDGEDDNC